MDLRIGRGGENDAGAAELLQFGGGIAGGSIDVVSGSEFSRQRFFVFAAPDGEGAEAHLPRILDSKMAEASDALNGDQIAGRAPELRSALNTVMPAHSSGAASAAARSSGIAATASAGAIMYSW